MLAPESAEWKQQSVGMLLQMALHGRQDRDVRINLDKIRTASSDSVHQDEIMLTISLLLKLANIYVIHSSTST